MSETAKIIRLSFDEFKLYYESTEKVTDRRLETNRWNYSVCMAILVAVATISSWSLSNPALTRLGLTAGALLCVMAILFCFLWVRQIGDFKNLNNAKFAVLSEMAPSVDFDFSNPGEVISFCPFDKEWKRMDELKAIKKIGLSNIVALKSSTIEYFIPQAFAVLFFVILVTGVAVVATHWPPSSLAQHPAKPAASSPQGRTP
jgi:di/tricarboxylate transporter